MEEFEGKQEAIQNLLLDWFAIHGRSFPWRKTRNPYAILVAEKLLQQTSVRASLINAFKILLHKYPHTEALAKANIDELYKIVAPLGLHYRAHELRSLAIFINSTYDGKIPNDIKSLLAIPGVGDYIARAVMSFAFAKDFAVVDVNVGRILYRLFEIQDRFPSNPARNRRLKELALWLLPKGRSREFNLALIDLGALVCKSLNPKCDECPLHTICKYANAK